MPTLTLHFTRMTYSPGAETWTIREAAGADGVLGWVDVDWDGTWHVAVNRKEK